MSDKRAFVDTNVLVYAHDVSAGSKHTQAQRLLTSLWDSGEGCLSIQVLQEFYVNITRKVNRPLPAGEAARLISDLSQWEVHTPSVNSILNAIERQQRLNLSFWDALIVTSAIELDCETLWSEDLNAGQTYDQVKVLNPFVA